MEQNPTLRLKALLGWAFAPLATSPNITSRSLLFLFSWFFVTEPNVRFSYTFSMENGDGSNRFFFIRAWTVLG